MELSILYKSLARHVSASK